MSGIATVPSMAKLVAKDVTPTTRAMVIDSIVVEAPSQEFDVFGGGKVRLRADQIALELGVVPQVEWHVAAERSS